MPQSPVFQRPIAIGLPPTAVQGARITTPITLTSLFLANHVMFGTTDTVDMVMEDAEGVINNIQTMFVDNSASPAPFLITFPETQQTVWVPQRSQGYWPVAIGQQGQIQAAAYLPGGAGYSCFVQFLNVPVQTGFWPTGFGSMGKAFAISGTSAGNTSIILNTENNAAILPASSNPQSCLYGFDITGVGATAASNIVATVTGVVLGFGGTSTLSYDIAVPVIGSGNVNLSIRYNPPLYSAANSHIGLTVPAFGAGNTSVHANIQWGVL